jgi:hypothetical protein
MVTIAPVNAHCAPSPRKRGEVKRDKPFVQTELFKV